MNKYTVIFKDGTEKAFTEDQGFKNRIAVYNYIIENGLSKEHKGIKEIKISVMPR